MQTLPAGAEQVGVYSLYTDFFELTTEQGGEHMDNNTMLEVINILKDNVNRTDEINKRLTNVVKTAIIAFAISFAVTIISISYLYFNGNYNYPDITQTQNNNQNQNLNVNGGQ